MNLLLLTSGLAGFFCLAAAMSRHSAQLLRYTPSATTRHRLRISGWLLLTASFTLAVMHWHANIGPVVWLGWLTIAGLLLTFSMPYWPGQPAPKKRSRQKTAPQVSSPAANADTRHSLPQTVCFSIAMLLPLTLFSWQLLTAPEKPLLRNDAIHGSIGPWTFSMAEKDRKAPEIAALGVPLKIFTIRFCDTCNADIRMAYLKIRQPRSTQAAGNAFTGRGPEKTVEIPIPAAATEDDRLWLTVEAKNGAIYQQAFNIRHASPALARFIREQL